MVEKITKVVSEQLDKKTEEVEVEKKKIEESKIQLKEEEMKGLFNFASVSQNISEELKRSWNIEVDPSTIADLLKGMGFSLQQNKKKLGTANQLVDRNAQFKHINRQAKRHMEENQPVISVDTKRKN